MKMQSTDCVLLYDDDGFSGRMIIVEEFGGFVVSHLKSYKTALGETANFNDKTTALKIGLSHVTNLYYEFWEDDHYSGRCLVLRTAGGRAEINLKDHPLAGSLKSWNGNYFNIHR